MKIENAKYVQFNGKNSAIVATINGIYSSVPLDPNNRHYAEILKQVADGILTIKDAD
tara:strand:- start:258 stop:428 length:171 start_codon:yes stop_codon:yes gene_type:complete